MTKPPDTDSVYELLIEALKEAEEALIWFRPEARQKLEERLAALSVIAGFDQPPVMLSELHQCLLQNRCRNFKKLLLLSDANLTRLHRATSRHEGFASYTQQRRYC